MKKGINGFLNKRHGTRPRNIEHNKKFAVIRTSDIANDGTISVPKIANTPIPLREEVKDPVKLPHSYHPNGYYVRHKWLGEESAVLEYELQEADMPLLADLKRTGVVDASLIEWLITVWERDTEKGQVIPLERAWVLVADKDQLLTVSQRKDLVERVYDHWIRRRHQLKHALVRRFWKSDLCDVKYLKLVFRPFAHERMKTRNSRKNDRDSLHQMRQLKNNLDELYDLLVSVQMRETLKKYLLEVEVTQFEQQVGELTNREFVHENVSALMKNDILEQSAQRRKSSKFLDESPRGVGQIEYPTSRPKPPKAPSLHPVKKNKLELGPELALALCAIVEGMGVVSLPLKRSVTVREEEAEDVVDSAVSTEVEEPRVMVRGRRVRGMKALAVERFLPGTFSSEFYDGIEASFSEEEELDDRYCKALGSAFKNYVREKRIVSH